MKKSYKKDIKEAIKKVSENIGNNRPLSEKELSILFLATFLEEEAHENK